TTFNAAVVRKVMRKTVYSSNYKQRSTDPNYLEIIYYEVLSEGSRTKIITHFENSHFFGGFSAFSFKKGTKKIFITSQTQPITIFFKKKQNQFLIVAFQFDKTDYLTFTKKSHFKTLEDMLKIDDTEKQIRF
ncbi:hypothetical protein, partial [Testudinibacter aquarius]